jgi:PPP family 3-phenylpropionic acid transporter
MAHGGFPSADACAYRLTAGGRHTAPMPAAFPYWKLSSFYFWYLAALGAFTPFFARWLHELGLQGVAIGAVMAMWYLSRILAPPAWGALCARSSHPLRWLQFGCVAMTICFAGFLWARGFWPLLLTMLAFGSFANAVLPQFEAITLDRLGQRRHLYGRIRLWGSLGFLAVAVGYGPLLDVTGIAALPLLTLPLLVATVVAALANGRLDHAIDSAPVPRLREVLRRREVRAFFLMALLMQAAFGPFYVVYTLHLAQSGHSGLVIGLLWGLGVFAEILVFFFMGQVFRRWNTDGILLLCLAASVVRWIVVGGWPESLVLMALAQCVHALSFGAFHAACMQRVTEFFPGRLGQHGQGIMFGFSSGVGGVLGALMAGGLWQLGGGRAAFFASSAICAFAWLLAWRARRQRATV